MQLWRVVLAVLAETVWTADTVETMWAVASGNIVEQSTTIWRYGGGWVVLYPPLNSCFSVFFFYHTVFFGAEKSPGNERQISWLPCETTTEPTHTTKDVLWSRFIESSP